MTNRAFLIWLGVFGSPTALLFWLLTDAAPGPYPPIGGGGYDLSDFVYSAALLLLTGLWVLAALTAALIYRDARRALVLAGLAAVAFGLAVLLHGQNLN